MREDITQPDLIAFCISAVMISIMSISFLMLVSILYKSPLRDVKRVTSSANQSKRGRASTGNCTVFNWSLFGMILGSTLLVSSLLVSLTYAHSTWVIKGMVSVGTLGGTIFESSYCAYSWSRSKSILRNQSVFVYWILTVLAAVNPILFSAQFISCVLYEERIIGILFYRICTVSAVAGVFLLDMGLFLCFAFFLFKTPAPTTLSGRFNGNSEAANQWRRTEVVARYGLLSTCLSFVGLGILIPSELFPSLNAYSNLMHACAYSVACWLAVVLLAMKMELEGGCSKLFASSYQSTNYSSQSKEESIRLQNEVKQ
ncbi:hypothetical protein HDU77_008711 [Chytriomyces hyalinus]|nr:hypothetical protein HDU77_008711 [Chytriomyces hyalinus]